MNGRRVVITGIGVISGLGNTLEAIERRIYENESSIREVTRFDTSGMGCSVAAEVSLKPDERAYDTCVHFVVAAAESAINNSGLELGQIQTLRAGLALGTCCGGNTLENAIVEGVFESTNALIAQSPVYEQADTAAQHLGLTGPVTTFNSACSASGSAIGFAAELIAKGYTDIMLAGGADVLQKWTMIGFNQVRALNPNPCTPFGELFGLSLGEGSSIVVLESLQSALERGANIYAELLGYGLSNDAYHATAPAPGGDGIRDAIRMALQDGGTDAERIDYLNAHGTGTKLNDHSELSGIRAAIGDTRFPELPISSFKGHVGHMLGAAASTELVFSLLALQKGYLPGTANTRQVRDGLGGANILTGPVPFDQATTFLSSNAGMGGHNSVLLARKWEPESENTDDDNIPFFTKRVYITGIGMVDSYGADRGASFERIGTMAVEGSCSFHLRNYDPSLNERGADRVVHFALGAADLAIKDTNWMEMESDRPIGMVFGTSFGEAESIMEYYRAVLTDKKGGSTTINFPKGALNSTAGIVSKALSLKGFSSSLTTGGNDGLYALTYAFEAINGNKGVNRCLVAAAEEFSEWMNLALESRPDSISFPFAEGACTVAIQEAMEDGLPPSGAYAEISGFGFSSGGEVGQEGKAVWNAVLQCLERCNTTAAEVDAVLFSSLAAQTRHTLQEIFTDKPVTTLHEGIALSVHTLQHVCYAAHWLSDRREEKLAGQLPHVNLPEAAEKIMIVGNSINGGAGAVLLRKMI